MFDAKFCEIVCIGLTVTLNIVPESVASVTLLFGHLYLIVNFKVTM